MCFPVLLSHSFNVCVCKHVYLDDVMIVFTSFHSIYFKRRSSSSRLCLFVVIVSFHFVCCWRLCCVYDYVHVCLFDGIVFVHIVAIVAIAANATAVAVAVATAIIIAVPISIIPLLYKTEFN